jgi:hypothetical protein
VGRAPDDRAHGNVLVRTDGETTDYRFPLAIYDTVTAKGVQPSVAFDDVKVASNVWHTVAVDAAAIISRSRMMARRCSTPETRRSEIRARSGRPGDRV